MHLSSICGRLSARETDVLHTIIAGQREKEAARTLGISHRTVEAHRLSIRLKLQARTTGDIVRIALRGA
jgi:two-component system, LuxR family, response regulator FixJ